MDHISAIIITKNEERNIRRCLESLAGVADEIIVVDSGSTDATEALCREAGVHFERHEWEGYDGQKNYADSLASQEWTLSIDADEALSPELRESLKRMKQEGLEPGTVYSVNRLTNYCGRWIQHCGWYPDARIRLWRTGAATWDGEVHEELLFHEPQSPRTATLHGDLLHYSYYSVSEHVQRTAKYATMAGEKAFHQGRRYRGGLALKTAWTFLRCYLLRGGLLDGRAGYTVSKISSFYTLIKYARLRELTQQEEDKE
ncbi:MAG: glycosyltransferase family 2 protein [Bacteroidales bacterium]|nr:glycosyltransferase family 2 protein [Bacteroidales bacterium]